MITKQNIYHLLVLFTLISFGFFGSLSHLFSLSLITLMCAEYIRSDKEFKNNNRASTLYFALSGCFFLFLFTSLFHSGFGTVFDSLAPMLPIPIIGMLLIFHNRTKFKLSSKKLSQFSQISILFALIIYLLLKLIAGTDTSFHHFHSGRLTLFSGNPIPFSFCMLGISIFCLANWQYSTKKNKIIAFLLFLTGAYFAGYLSGTRGTLLALLLVFTLVIFYIFNELRTRFFIISTFAFVGIVIFQISLGSDLENSYFIRIKSGFETITVLENNDYSIWLRLDMWSAGIKAFFEAPIFGYGINERFTALKPYLNNSNINFTHPHNDIIAGFLSSGVLGGVAVLISLVSGFAIAIFNPKWSSIRLYFGLMISCSTMVTGNVSTVLFNDISAAWLAFSTYLVWATDFEDDQSRLPN